jgi:hypothetical protein
MGVVGAGNIALRLELAAGSGSAGDGAGDLTAARALCTQDRAALPRRPADARPPKYRAAGGPGGRETIRAYSREDFETRRYKAVNDELLGRNIETVKTFSNNFPFAFFLANLGTLVIVLYSGLQVIGGTLSVGELIALTLTSASCSSQCSR